MNEFLEYLTADEHRRLLERARHLHYDPGDVIVQENERRHALHVIRSGEVRVQRSHQGFDIEIARLGPGEIFGEMSLVNDYPASASVIADRPAEVIVIDEAEVQALIEGDPGFAGRFYHSLAGILSRRLRETTEIGIAEFSWGGRDVERIMESEDAAAVPSDSWGGGSPLRGEE